MRKQDDELTRLVKAAFDREREELLAEIADKPDPPFSAAFLQKMQQLQEQAAELSVTPAAAKAPSRRRRRRLGWVAALAAILALLAAVSVAGENHWKRMNVKETDSAILITETSDMHLPEDWPHIWQPTWLPEGYVEKECFNTHSFVVYWYADPLDDTRPQVEFTQYRNISDMGIDHEDVEIIEMKVGNYPGWLFEKDGFRSLYWTDEEFAFELNSGLSKEELLCIATNLQKIE